MDSLKVEVERIVGPVKARARLKDVFREELWGHLAGLYREESRGADGERRALDRALRRLGDPELLRAVFISSLSRTDRWEGWLVSALARSPGETAARHVTRLAAWLFLPPWLSLALLLVVTFPFPGMGAGTYTLTVATFTLALFAATAYAVLALSLMMQVGGRRDRHVPARFAGGALAVAGVTLLAGLAGHPLLAWVPGMQGQYELVRVFREFCTDFMALLCASLTVLTALFLNSAIRRVRRNPVFHDWPRLDPS